jgi:hypothetical protein
MPITPAIRTFRDAELSLWQAAVHESVGDAPAPAPTAPPAGVLASLLNRVNPVVGAAWRTAVGKTFVAAAGGLAAVTATSAGAIGDLLSRAQPFLRSAEDVGQYVEMQRSLTGRDPIADMLPTGTPLTPEALPSPDLIRGDFTKFGLLVMALARRAGDDPNAFMDLLKTRYANLDFRWAQAALNYFLYVKSRHQGIPGYLPPASANDATAIIEGRLPDRATVAIVGDWGTGTPEARVVLERIAARDPHVVIHLGDVYYAGAESQFIKFRQTWKDFLHYDQPDGVVPLTLSGNHDMYSGGDPYYKTLGEFGQRRSYFCLRNANWQFVAMDTGLKNSDILIPVNPDQHDDPHGLHTQEAAWVREKVANAGGRKTILLSHHQPFSAFEKLTGGGPVNVELLDQMRPVLGGVCRWFWGHEHDLVIYLDEEKYQGVLGRCVGHGAIPMDVLTYRLDTNRPRATDDFPIPHVADVSLDRVSENASFYNHGYVIIELDGDHGTATYYQASDPEKVLLTEDLA